MERNIQKKAIAWILVITVLGGLFPSFAQTSNLSTVATTVSKSETTLKPLKTPELGSQGGQLWTLGKGYLVLESERKGIIQVKEDGSQSLLYNGAVGLTWQNGAILYFVDQQTLTINALDLKLLTWKTVYYLNDLSITYASGNVVVVQWAEGLKIINLETKTEADAMGRFSNFSIGNQCIYALNEALELCQINLDGTVLVLGEVGWSEFYQLKGKFYLIDPVSGKLKQTEDRVTYRAASDTAVSKIEATEKNLIFLEKNNAKCLYSVDENTGRTLKIKMPCEVVDFAIQDELLTIRDSKGELWKSNLAQWLKTPENKVSKFIPLIPRAISISCLEDTKGILTFRGGNLRQNSAYGSAIIEKKLLQKMWTFSVPPGESKWGGGAGWTGQPLLVQWPQKTKAHMNISQQYKDDSSFVEVIQASLNGNVYFVDMASGKPTRPAIKIGNPIKGTPSVDARGVPLLYVGDGIADKNKAGFRIFSLLDQKELFFQSGLDLAATRRWPAFDSSAVFDRVNDRLIVGGENGVLYQFKLNTKFDAEKGTLSIAETKKTYQAKISLSKEGKPLREGIENSVAFYKDRYYFATNSGQVRCVDQNMKLVWEVNNYDDTDACVTVDIEEGKPVVYTASEVDLQGKIGTCRILKIDGNSGKVLWKKSYTCMSKFGESPSNGGALSSNIVGKNDIDNVVIFNLARCEKIDQGSLIALDKKTGKQVWRKNMSTYAWSSPVAIYDENGKSYILQNDHSGTVHLFEGISGKELWKGKVDTYLEATPAVFNNKIVFSSRTGKMYCFEIL